MQTMILFHPKNDIADKQLYFFDEKTILQTNNAIKYKEK